MALRSNQTHVVKVLLVGPMGSGKSTFAAKATHDPGVRTGSGFRSGILFPKPSYTISFNVLTCLVTHEIEEYVTNYGEFEIHVIDTPGWDEGGSDIGRSAFTRIVNYINSPECEGQLGGVLYFQPVHGGRIDQNHIRYLRAFEEMIGKTNFGRCTLVTTMWDRLRPLPDRDLEEAESRERELEEDDELWKIMRTSSIHGQARMERFDNTADGATRILAPHLNGTAFTPAVIHEINYHARGALETSAGQIIDPAATRERALIVRATRLEADLGQKAELEARLLARMHEIVEANKGFSSQGETLGAKIQAMVEERSRKEGKEKYTKHQVWFHKKSKKLKRKIWVWRGIAAVGTAGVLGGTVAASVLTLGAALPSLAAISLPAIAWMWREDRVSKKQKELQDDHEKYLKELAVEYEIGFDDERI